MMVTCGRCLLGGGRAPLAIVPATARALSYYASHAPARNQFSLDRILAGGKTSWPSSNHGVRNLAATTAVGPLAVAPLRSAPATSTPTGASTSTLYRMLASAVHYYASNTGVRSMATSSSATSAGSRSSSSTSRPYPNRERDEDDRRSRSARAAAPDDSWSRRRSMDERREEGDSRHGNSRYRRDGERSPRRDDNAGDEEQQWRRWSSSDGRPRSGRPQEEPRSRVGRWRPETANNDERPSRSPYNSHSQQRQWREPEEPRRGDREQRQRQHAPAPPTSPQQPAPPSSKSRVRSATPAVAVATATAAAAAAATAAAAAAAAKPTGATSPPPSQPPSASKSESKSKSKPSDASQPQLPQPEGVYPTFVPRNPGISDGEWSARDEGMVQQAQQDADAAAAAARDFKAMKPKGVVLLGAEPLVLEALAERYGQPRYRGSQLQDAVLRGAASVWDIATMPKPLRAKMAADGVRTGRSRLHGEVGDEDGTRKFLLQLHDGRIIETVGIPGKGGRLTACVSSQVGCPMRCTFCATGKGGFARQLAPHEIIDQVLHVQEKFGLRVSNVVFMGMGEPLLNLPSVVRACQVLNTQVGIGAAFITISTVGVPNAIGRLALSPLKATLAVSLHAATQQLRESIIPSAKAYPLEALMQDCVTFYKRTGRRVTFEYTLLSGVNDSDEHAQQLLSLLRQYDMMSHVNLIPWNPVDESTFTRPSRNRVYAFQRVIEAGGLAVSIRETRGLEAAAACGQLRNQFQKQPLPKFEAPR